MMTDWCQRCINALQRNGKGERTQEAYTRAVWMLSDPYGLANTSKPRPCAIRRIAESPTGCLPYRGDAVTP
jgi:hypothetical protein